MSVKGVLQAALTSEQVPPELVLTYDDRHGLWGGVLIVIHGSGRGERREWAAGAAQPRVFVRAISQTQLLELIKLLVEREAWVQQTPDRQPVPDESRATLTISVGGQTSGLWEWYNEMAENNRLLQIKTMMTELTHPRPEE